ncbi:MAG: hypothetical protein D3920_15440 [Candidatus Electrothrix sp. AW2]|nr:hypothetical protein [Candidatus Electrothrix sp. AX1]MCI5136418.1 hypothetical protein [Candidatus Electrothrix gigas]
MGLYPQVDQASFLELRDWWKNSPQWVKPEDYEVFLDNIAYRLSKESSEGKNFLKRYVYSVHLPYRRSALCFFADPDHITIETRQILLDAFHEDNLLLKNDVVWTCINLTYFPLERQEIEILVHYPDARLSALAEVYLCYAFPEERVIRLQKCLSSENPRKREYACDVIGDEYIEELKIELQRLINDPHQDVRDAARINAGFFE